MDKVKEAGREDRDRLVKQGVIPATKARIKVVDKRNHFKPSALVLAEIRHYQEDRGAPLVSNSHQAVVLRDCSWN